jgi:hypothetical protein
LAGLLEAAELTVADVEQAWRARAEQFRSGRIRVSVARFTAKGAITARRAGGPFSMKQQAVAPPDDVNHEFTCSLTFQGKKLRFSTDEPVWYGSSGSFYSVELVGACDGEVASMLYSSPPSVPFRHQGTVQAGDRMIAPLGSVQPLLDHFCPELHAIRWLPRCRLTAQREVLDDTDCVVLALPVQRALSEILLLDPDRGFLILRRLHKLGETIHSVCDVSYVEDAKYGYLPSGWVRERYGSEGDLWESVKTKVEQLELNVPIEEGEFRIEFPEGTLVERLASPKDDASAESYLVLADQQQRPVTRAELARKDITPELLAATKPGEAGMPTRRVSLFAVWAAGLGLLGACLGIAAWRRRRTARRAEQ